MLRSEAPEDDVRWESGNEKLKGAEHKETKREGEGKKKTGEKTAAKVLHGRS